MAYIEMNYKSESLNREVSLQVILPSHEGFGNDRYPCKTLYFLHGINGNAQELTRFLQFTVQSLLKGIAIVLCDGENSFYADRGDGLSNYRKFVEEELVQVTRAIFPLSDKREDTFIGGISMGGHGALVTGLSKPETFSKIAVLSPCIDFYDAAVGEESPIPVKALDMIYGSREAYMQSDRCCVGALQHALSKGKKLPEILIGCGTEDPLIYDQQRDFAAMLLEKGIQVEHVETKGAHDIFLWQELLGCMFEFLTGEGGAL